MKGLLERSPVKLINLTNYLKKFTLKLESFIKTQQAAMHYHHI